MGILDQLWERIRDLFTEEELNNLIIQEQQAEQDRLRREQERPVLQIPLEPPQPPPSVYDEPAEEEKEQRGVVIIDL